MAGALALTLFATSARDRGGAVVHGSLPAMREHPTDVPDDWAALPSVTHWEPENVVSGREDSLFSSSVVSLARFGDVFLRYRVSRCGWGGSACAGSSTTASELRFGSLDERGEPAFPLAFTCTSTPPIDYYQHPPHRSCAPESFAVRSDGHRFVLTIHDPDTVESPVAAFARAPVRVLPARSTASWSSDRVLLAALAAALLLAGGFALAKARSLLRHVSWIPSKMGGEDVLVDPRAPVTGTAYRDTDPPAPEHVFRGTLERATFQAELATRLALFVLLASALVSMVAILAY